MLNLGHLSRGGLGKPIPRFELLFLGLRGEVACMVDSVMKPN
jgi:hypothetical protein